jgi:hypothetical protein
LSRCHAVRFAQWNSLSSAPGLRAQGFDVVEAINFDYATTVEEPFSVLGFPDDGNPDERLLKTYEMTHLGAVDLLAEMPAEVGYVIGIGSPAIRQQIDARFATDRPSPVLVHPSATMGRAVELGPERWCALMRA